MPIKVSHKGWGREEWLYNNEFYCAKWLIMSAGKRMSWHYHSLKTESFLILEGECIARVSPFDSIEDAEEIHLSVGDRLDITVGLRHRLEAVEDSRILEVSTTHFESDSHRIIRGD